MSRASVQGEKKRNEEFKPRPETYNFYIKTFFLIFKQAPSMFWSFSTVWFFFFHKTDLLFMPAPTDKQANRQIAAIIYLKSFAQVLALSNVIANKDWQLVPSAVLVFLISITSQTSMRQTGHFRLDIKLHWLLISSAQGHIWLQSVTCKSSINRLFLLPKSVSSCGKPKIELLHILKHLFNRRRIFKKTF